MPNRFRLFWLFLLVVAGAAFFRGENSVNEPVFADNSLPDNLTETPVALPELAAGFHTPYTGAPMIVSRRNATDMVHSASVAELADGRLLATWFGGSREGAKDVAIYGAYFSPVSGLWSDVQPLITREATQQALGRYIKKLGNPVITRLSEDRLALIYVSVSLGGWATSQLNMALSDDQGASWHSYKRLVTSPFFNLSTLVKGTPHRYTDGSIALPVYHEMAGKFGELLRISPDGEVLSKSRLTTGREAIQPVILPVTQAETLALLRDTGDDAPFTAVMTSSANSGTDWSTPENASFFNPNSALAAIVMDCGRLLAVANDTEDERNRLTLLVSEDRGASWNPIMRVEDNSDNGQAPRRVPKEVFTETLHANMSAEGLSETQRNQFIESATDALCSDSGCRYRYDYPYLIKASDGTIHLVYTWNKAYIKHRAFSQEWLSQWI